MLVPRSLQPLPLELALVPPGRELGDRHVPEAVGGLEAGDGSDAHRVLDLGPGDAVRGAERRQVGQEDGWAHGYGLMRTSVAPFLRALRAAFRAVSRSSTPWLVIIMSARLSL